MLRLVYNETVILRGFNNNFLSVQPDGTLACKGNQSVDHSIWRLTYHPDGSISLKSSVGLYLASEPSGAFIANRPNLGPWEKFRVETRTVPDGRICLQSCHGHYLCVTPDGTVEHRCVAGEWEYFHMESVESFQLRGHQELQLQLQPAIALTPMTSSITAFPIYEPFTVVAVNDDEDGSCLENILAHGHSLEDACADSSVKDSLLIHSPSAP